MPSSSGPRGWLALLVLAAALSWLAVLALPAAPAVGAVRSSRPSLTLTGQSEWVAQPSTGGPAQFDLDLRATGAPGDATVSAVLYSRLETRSGFEQAVTSTSGPGGYQVGQTTPVALSGLPADPRAPGTVDLDVAVSTTTPVAGTSGPALGLGCAPPTGTGTCAGVYPVLVELRSSTGDAHFTTFLTYADGPSDDPLDVAWVLPVVEPVAVRSHPTGPAGVVASLPRSEVADVGGLVDQLRANPELPVTLAASPETVQALDSSGPAGRAAAAGLSALSANQSVDEVLSEPYVPIDLGALAGAGESTEVMAQMDEGAGVMTTLHVQTTPMAATVVASGDVGSDLADGLAQVGATRVVVPCTDVATSCDAGTGTLAATFHLQLGTATGTTRTVTAAASDGFLASQFSRVASDPALAASQLLADLAMVHFELPYATATRGVIALPPTGWEPDATFDRVLLAGLQGNPDVTPVTLSTYFRTVATLRTAATGGTRSFKPSDTEIVLQRSLRDALTTDRTTLTGFAGAVPSHPPVLTELDQILLASEDDRLRPADRSAVLRTFTRVLDDQRSLVQFAIEKTVTLTARTGWIPITVVSKAPYTVVGRLSIDGHEELQFPHGSSIAMMRLDHRTNPVRIDVVARSSGDLPVDVEFTTLAGTFVIATGTITVRSTATSLVGVALTAVALAVLLTWWARTWWSGRRRRAGAVR